MRKNVLCCFLAAAAGAGLTLLVTAPPGALSIPIAKADVGEAVCLPGLSKAQGLLEIEATRCDREGYGQTLTGLVGHLGFSWLTKDASG